MPRDEHRPSTATGTDQLTESLTDAQREAVQHLEGPLLILAGPGSGKTRVVTHRIAHLVEHGIPPQQILGLTFTNKAAAEMQSRVEQLVPGARIWLSTFHRFGARILRRYAEHVGLTPNFTIYDAGDSRQVLKRIIESHDVRTYHYGPDRLAAAISSAKNRLLTPEEYEPRRSSPLSNVVAKVYPLYQQRLIASAAVDFDDLLLHVATLLHDNPEIRAQLDEQFRYILVDEYQDTNRAQYVILRALSVDHPNLAATGDPDQSIYGWRGADISNILDFEADYGHVHVVRLEKNYRSTKRILQVADALIARNTRRKQKALYTDNAAGDPVRIVSYGNQDEEARGIAQEIATEVASGRRRPRDFAVFYRVNALSRTLEKAFRDAAVPYQIVRGQEFYQRKEIKDVLAYCQLVNNPRDDLAFMRVINTPPRGIGKRTVEALVAHAYTRGWSLWDAARDVDAIANLPTRSAKSTREFVAVIDSIAAVAAGHLEEILGVVVSASGYEELLADSESEEDLNRWANIQELLTDARQFDEAFPGGNQLEAYLERTWLVNETDDWETDSDKVTLMTMHAAKGLEFPVVFIVAMEQGLLPHERSRESLEDLEEERRLTFVGITRAEESLTMSTARRRDFRGQRRTTIPSSFLLEMQNDDVDYVELASDASDAPADESSQLPIDVVPGTMVADSQAAPSAPARGRRRGRPQITTAAKLLGRSEAPVAGNGPSPDAFAQGMAVLHPEFGPGKIVALSGQGDHRRATVRFATAGEKKFVLAYSPLKPAGS